MTAAALAGFALSLSLILAIGAQNAFVLRQGLRQLHVGPVVAGLLPVGGGADPCRGGRVRGGGESAPWALDGDALGRCGLPDRLRAASLRAAWTETEALETGGGAQQSLRAALATALVFTWANPHVYLDTVGLIGAVAATYGGRWAFGAGALAASCLFFVVLGYGARGLAPFFARPSAWRCWTRSWG
jgi:L-lysine exporter family protein LysE/ArgO